MGILMFFVDKLLDMVGSTTQDMGTDTTLQAVMGRVNATDTGGDKEADMEIGTSADLGNQNQNKS